MADDVDTELELARARARARQRVKAPAELQGAAIARTPSLPKGDPSFLGSGSASGAALRGFGQGASFGFADELEGGVKGVGLGVTRELVNLGKTPAGRAVVRALTGSDLPGPALDAQLEGSFQSVAKDLYDTRKPVPLDPDEAMQQGYRTGRDTNRRELVQAQTSHPASYFGSSIAGAIAAPGPKLKGLKGIERFEAAAKAGVGMGAAGALGSSNADLTQLDAKPEEKGKLAGDVLMGGLAGGVITPTAVTVGDKLGPVLRRLSQDNALKALGLRAGITNTLVNRGYESIDDGRQLGQAALDMELIRPFRTAADVAENAGFAKEVRGARIEQALADADASGVPFDTSRASWQATERVMGPKGLSTEAMSKARPAAGIVERILKQGDVDTTFSGANRLKSDIYDGINYGGAEPPLSTRMQRQAGRGLRESIEEQIGEAAGPDVADELRAANKDYGYLRDITALANDEATRQAARAPWYSPGTLAASSMAGAGGTMAAGLPGAAAGILPVASRALGPRIPSTMATAQRALAPHAGDIMGALARPALQVPMRPSKEEQERDAIGAFVSGGFNDEEEKAIQAFQASGM